LADSSIDGGCDLSKKAARKLFEKNFKKPIALTED
jgi:hypothetical protein